MENSWNRWRKRQMVRPASPMSDLGHEQTSRHVASCPLFPSKRTFISAVCTSTKCHKQIYCRDGKQDSIPDNESHSRCEAASRIVRGTQVTLPAGRKKESNAAFHVRSNLGIQLLKLLAKQRSQQQGKQH